MLRLHGPNVVSFQLVLGGQRCNVVGFYLVPYDALTIESIVVAMIQQPHGAEMLVAGNFNSDLAAPERNTRDEEIVAALAMIGVEYMSDHFLPRRKPWLRDGRMWIMRCGGREVRSWTNYILGTYHHLLQKVLVQDARHNADYYLDLGFLHKDAPADHSRYLGKLERFPLKPPKTPGGFNHLSAELQGSIPNSPWWEQPHQAWISPETWQLIDTRIPEFYSRYGDQRRV